MFWDFCDEGAYLNLAYELLEDSRAWVPVRSGESGDFIYHRDDGLAYAKIASPARVADLADERRKGLASR